MLVFGAFANAAGMVGPVAEWQKRLASLVGFALPYWRPPLFYLLAARRAAAAGRRRRGRAESSVGPPGRPAPWKWRRATLMPWCRSASACGWRTTAFHFLTSYDTAVPVAQRFAADLGLTSLGEPAWGLCLLSPRGGVAAPLGDPLSGYGLLLSLYSRATAWRPSLKALAPWALLMVLLFAAGYGFSSNRCRCAAPS